MLELNVDKEHASESKRNSDFVTVLHNFPQIALGTPRQKGMVVPPLFISTVFNTLLTPHAGNPWLPKAGKHLKQLVTLHWLVRALSGDIPVEQVQRGSIEQDLDLTIRMQHRLQQHMRANAGIRARLAEPPSRCMKNRPALQTFLPCSCTATAAVAPLHNETRDDQRANEAGCKLEHLQVRDRSFPRP